MATLSDLISKVRTELNDQPRQFTKVFTSVDGATKDFTLGYKPLDTTTLMVQDNSTTLTNPTTYTVEELYGVVHTATAPTAGHTLTVTGNVYRYFTDTQLTYYVNTAVLQHTNNRTDSFGSAITISTLPAIEEYAVVILATVEALWALATDAAFDIDIQAPDGVSIPRSERFRQLSAIIESRKEQYRNYCAALNIGIWRIEMGTLRRVSRTTNKLVPVYIPQEIDDSTSAERVYLQNDLNGRTVIASTVTTQDLLIYQGDTFSQTVTLPSTAGLTTSASVTANVAANTNITIPANTAVTVGMSVAATGGTITSFPANTTVTKVVNSTTIWLSNAVNISGTTLNYLGQTFAAQIRTYPDSPTLWTNFTVTVSSYALSQVTLSIAAANTAILPVRCFWDIQGTSLADSTTVTTFLRGQVFTTPQVTQV